MHYTLIVVILFCKTFVLFICVYISHYGSWSQKFEKYLDYGMAFTGPTFS